MNKGLVSVFALVVAFLSGCGIPGSEDSVHIVIPEEYRGVFKITADGRGDEVFKENGSYRFGIPETGILGVRDTAPLRTFQEMKVTFESGENLPEGMFENEHRLAYYYLW